MSKRKPSPYFLQGTFYVKIAFFPQFYNLRVAKKVQERSSHLSDLHALS